MYKVILLSADNELRQRYGFVSVLVKGTSIGDDPVMAFYNPTIAAIVETLFNNDNMFEKILTERKNLGGEHHSPTEWSFDIFNQLERYREATTFADFEERLVKIAALAIAALQSHKGENRLITVGQKSFVIPLAPPVSG